MSASNAAAGKPPPESEKSSAAAEKPLSAAKENRPVPIAVENLVEGKDYYYGYNQTTFPIFFQKITLVKKDPSPNAKWFEIQNKKDGYSRRLQPYNEYKSKLTFFDAAEGDAYAAAFRAARREAEAEAASKSNVREPVPIPFENLVVGNQYIMNRHHKATRNFYDRFDDNTFKLITIVEKVPSTSGKVLRIQYERVAYSPSHIKTIDFSKDPDAVFYAPTDTAKLYFGLLTKYNTIIRNWNPRLVPYDELEVGKEYIEKMRNYPAQKIRLTKLEPNETSISIEANQVDPKPKYSNGWVSFSVSKPKNIHTFYNYKNVGNKRVNYLMSRKTKLPENIGTLLKKYGGKRVTRKLKKRNHRTRKH